MDDLIKFIIWAVIIYSFVRPFIKKKEQPKQPSVNSTKPKESVSFKKENSGNELATATKKQESYDILRELENMFKGNLKVPDTLSSKQESKNKVDQYDIYSDSAIKDMDLNKKVDPRLHREVEDQKPIGYRKTYDESKNIHKISQRNKPVVDAKTEKKAVAFERVLAGPRKQRDAVIEFNRKLKNPSTVREYILFSEILGKPKALRR